MPKYEKFFKSNENELFFTHRMYMVDKFSEFFGKEYCPYTPIIMHHIINAYAHRRHGVTVNSLSELIGISRPKIRRRIRNFEKNKWLKSSKIGNQILWEPTEKAVDNFQKTYAACIKNTLKIAKLLKSSR